MGFSEILDAIVQRVSSFAGGDIAALIIFLLAIAFTVTVAKTAFKVIAGAIAFLAVLYLANPNIYALGLSMLEKFWNAVCAICVDLDIKGFFASIFTGAA